MVCPYLRFPVLRMVRSVFIVDDDDNEKWLRRKLVNFRQNNDHDGCRLNINKN